MKPTSTQLLAIETCDKTFDGLFYYGVKSTKIFCKPSCRSRMPKVENIDIYPDTNELIALGYRPCKRCKPTGVKLPDEEWIDEVSSYIDEHYMEKLTLQNIADETHSSPFHLHRKFKEIKQITIGEYIKKTRMNQATSLLLSTKKEVAEIGLLTGVNNPSQFSRDFKNYHGVTPAQYRKEHNNYENN